MMSTTSEPSFRKHTPNTKRKRSSSSFESSTPERDEDLSPHTQRHALTPLPHPGHPRHSSFPFPPSSPSPQKVSVNLFHSPGTSSCTTELGTSPLTPTTVHNTPSPISRVRERSPEPSPLSFRFPQTPTGKRARRSYSPKEEGDYLNDFKLSNNNIACSPPVHPASATTRRQKHTPSQQPTFLGPSAENEFLVNKEERRSQYLIDYPHDVAQIGSNRFQEDFESLKMLERGDNGEVYLVCHRITGVRYAIKKTTKNCRWKSMNCPYVYDYNQNVFGEARALATLQHPNIVNYFFSWVEQKQLYLQLEYCSGGSLEGYVKSKTPMATGRLLKICRHICSALDYLAKQELVHCDIKPSNILMAVKKNINNIDHSLSVTTEDDITYKLSDFGTLQKEREVDLLVDDIEVGAGAYLPSILSSIRSSVDIFSLGITLFELACEGRVPKNRLKFVKHKEILGGNSGLVMRRLPSSSSSCSFFNDSASHSSSVSSALPTRPEKFQQLILDMILPDGTQRPTAGDVMRRIAEMEKEIME